LASLSRIYLGTDERLYFDLVTLGVCSSSVSVYSLSLESSLGILLPAMGIWIGTLIYTHTAWPMTALCGLFLIGCTRAAKNWYTYGMDSLKTNLNLHLSQEKLRLAMDSSGAASWEWEPLGD